MTPYRAILYVLDDPATSQIYTLSLHDALPISDLVERGRGHAAELPGRRQQLREKADRKSTRLNSSHMSISYAVFCLKKKEGYSGSKDESACYSRDNVATNGV